jgi:hypothetical protein
VPFTGPESPLTLTEAELRVMEALEQLRQAGANARASLAQLQHESAAGTSVKQQTEAVMQAYEDAVRTWRPAANPSGRWTTSPEMEEAASDFRQRLQQDMGHIHRQYGAITGYRGGIRLGGREPRLDPPDYQLRRGSQEEVVAYDGHLPPFSHVQASPEGQDRGSAQGHRARAVVASLSSRDVPASSSTSPSLAASPPARTRSESPGLHAPKRASNR